MNFRWLKRIRVVVSLAFFLLIAFLFIDFANTFSAKLVNGILYFQFFPSLLKFVSLTSILATGFIAVTLLSLVFGRVYCSFLCPLGTLQDILHFVAQKFRKKKRRKYYRPLNWIRFPILIAAAALLLFFGNVVFAGLLDPYSNFGRITSNFIRPIYFELNNLLTLILEKREIYSLKPVEMKSYSWLSMGYSVLLLGTLTWLSVKHGRLYCNTLCPVGTLLGRFSEVSLFKIKLDQVACTSCGICSNKCKANCIDSKNKFVDFSRCVGCLDCLYVCPGGGVKFEFSPKPVNLLSETAQSDVRRDFVKKSVLIPVALSAWTKTSIAQEVKNALIPINREHPVTPPGAVSQQHFNAYCTACTLCVSACPTQVLQPSVLEYGLQGVMQPRMDYKTSYCNFDCIICSEVCPTGAIKPIDLETKQLTQLGKAKFVKENCVVYTDETACGACSEHCPTKAVDMVPYLDKEGLTIPEVTEDICIGCGACEYACPTDPKSIYIEGNVEHVLAEKPKEEEIEKQELEEFPF